MRFGHFLFGCAALASCSPAPTPKSNAPTAVAPSTVDDPAKAGAACVEPKGFTAVKKREDGIDAFLEGRVSDALDLLDEAVRSDPRDRAADAFRRATVARIDARKTRAKEELKSIAAIVLDAVPVARSSKRTIPNITGGKLRLTKESEKKNLITDVADWEKKNELTSTRIDGQRLDNVTPLASGERPHAVFRHADHVVTLFSNRIVISGDGKRTYAFDTTAIVQAGFQIGFAQLTGGALIVQAGYNGYAKQSGGKNAYLAAFDAGSGELIWSSDPLVANAHEALISGGSIVTGYGFTAEPDFLFVVDLATGAVDQKIAVKSGPEAIRPKGDRIFVRTYDMDYVFKSATPISPAPAANLPRFADTGSAVDPETRCFVRNATAAIAARDRSALKTAVQALGTRTKDRSFVEFLDTEGSLIADEHRLDLLSAPLVALPAPSWEGSPATATTPKKGEPKLVKVKSAKADPVRDMHPSFSPDRAWFIAPVDFPKPLPTGARSDIPRTYGLQDLGAILPSGNKTLLVYGGRYIAVVRGDAAERVFDFELFRHPPKVNPQWKEFAQEDVTYAEERDGVLYVCNGGGSYAKEVFGKKGYLSAVDSSGKLVWRSPPLTCNSTFAMTDAFVISGYGFTEEPDFVFLIRRTDGAIVQRVPIDSAASAITVNQNQVHVESYGHATDFELR